MASEPSTVPGMRARCDSVVKIYPSATGQVLAINGVDIVLSPGELTALIGPSGSGKSTLLALIGLRDRPTAGEVSWDGRPTVALGRRDLARVRRRIRWISQRPAESLFPHLSAADHVLQTIRSTRVEGVGVDEALGRVGLTSVRDTPTRYLSGGEQQRLAVISAVIARAPILLADEPTAELDDATSALVFAELSALAAAGATVVVATHDARAQAVADRVVECKDLEVRTLR